MRRNLWADLGGGFTSGRNRQSPNLKGSSARECLPHPDVTGPASIILKCTHSFGVGTMIPDESSFQMQIFGPSNSAPSISLQEK